ACPALQEFSVARADPGNHTHHRYPDVCPVALGEGRRAAEGGQAEGRSVLRRPELVERRAAGEAQLERAAAVVIAVDVDDQVDRRGVRLDGDGAGGAQGHDGGVGDVGRVAVVVEG